MDDDGNLLRTGGTVSTTCSLQQRQREEPATEGEFSVTVWDLYLPSGTAIDTKAKVTVAGTDYEVIGQPWDASESEAVAHVEATVKRTA
jgi:hypothetical protein